ncbi:hypothetical protein EXT53_15665 [Pectobacterium polaris]|uniref:Uncharacterized protein n=1 Tax=Pectobacterium polaris TaxID=2042057 RepID=A0AAW5GGX3_9GAMM|nr:hypothetical protein [Pectobacterium polaris]
MGLALKGRCEQRSNLLPADLSPQSLTGVSSWGLARLPPSCNSNYLGRHLCYCASSTLAMI